MVAAYTQYRCKTSSTQTPRSEKPAQTTYFTLAIWRKMEQTRGRNTVPIFRAASKNHQTSFWALPPSVAIRFPNVTANEAGVLPAV